VNWSGVFPAATTQFKQDLSLDLAATARGFEALIDDGVHGLVVLGTCGENNSLSADEKAEVLKVAVDVSAKRIPVIAGVSELTTKRATEFAGEAQRSGADALMVLPAMVYVPTAAELEHHFRAVAQAVTLPIMLYNNPPAYRVNIDYEVLDRLSDQANIVSIKESSPDTRRFTDIIRVFGDRFIVMAGLDDVALEGLVLGAKGWISGLTSAFPRESVALVEAVARGDVASAREIYRWFMPLLHLDAGHDLVQSIKLAEQVMGRGSERVRAPRLPLEGARRDEVLSLVREAADSRPMKRAA